MTLHDDVAVPTASKTSSIVHTKPTLALEQRIVAQGFDLVIGLDEVGRGSLAGPVMVGACALSAMSLGKLAIPNGLADSKMLTPHRRQALIEPIHTWSDAYAVGCASNKEIDEAGISHSLGLAALRAISKLEQMVRISCEDSQLKVAAILDGPFDYITTALNAWDAPQIAIVPHVVTQIRADAACATVAGASVLAKVQRDALMSNLAMENPQYAVFHWERNKGYGSPAHREAIREFGPSDLHRISWHLV